LQGHIPRRSRGRAASAAREELPRSGVGVAKIGLGEEEEEEASEEEEEEESLAVW
jgi:hypothetical protein